MLLVTLISALQYGTLQSWAANISLLFIASGITGPFGSYVACAHLCANGVGALFASWIQTRFSHKEKILLLGFSLLNLVFSLFFIPTFPLGNVPDPALTPEGSPSSVPVLLDKWPLAILVTIHGLFAGAPIVALFDVASEMGYPESDGVTGGLVIAAVSLGMFVVPLLFSLAGIGYINIITTASLIIMLLLVVFLHIDYYRSRAEDAGEKTEAIAHQAALAAAEAEAEQAAVETTPPTAQEIMEVVEDDTEHFYGQVMNNPEPIDRHIELISEPEINPVSDDAG